MNIFDIRRVKLLKELRRGLISYDEFAREMECADAADGSGTNPAAARREVRDIERFRERRAEAMDLGQGNLGDVLWLDYEIRLRATDRAFPVDTAFVPCRQDRPARQEPSRRTPEGSSAGPLPTLPGSGR